MRYITSDGGNDPDTVSTPVCEARQSVLLTRCRPTARKVSRKGTVTPDTTQSVTDRTHTPRARTRHAGKRCAESKKNARLGAISGRMGRDGDAACGKRILLAAAITWCYTGFERINFISRLPAAPTATRRPYGGYAKWARLARAEPRLGGATEKNEPL